MNARTHTANLLKLPKPEAEMAYGELIHDRAVAIITDAVELHLLIYGYEPDISSPLARVMRNLPSACRELARLCQSEAQAPGLHAIMQAMTQVERELFVAAEHMAESGK